MIETLVERVKSIESIPHNVPVDRDKEIREEFERLRASNSVVNAVMSGTTAFLKEYQRLLGEYNSLKVYTPYSLPQDFKENVADLETCIGVPPLMDSLLLKLGGNPVGLGILGGIAGSLLINIRLLAEGRHQINRRELVYLTLIGGAALGTAGAIVGSFPPWLFKKNLEYLEQNAKYLDETYQRVFPAASTRREPTQTDRRGFFNILYHKA